MENNHVKERAKRMGNDLFDKTADESTELGADAIHAVFQYVRGWINNWINSKNSSKHGNPDEELKKLEQEIAYSDKITKIGMEKQSIAVMWAMRKLGYTEEQTREVLDLADKAYTPQE